MAIKEKKGTRKTATTKAVKKTTATKKAVAKKVVREQKKANQNSNILSIFYMFLLIFGISLVFVALTLKVANYIETSAMITCLCIALVLVILSSFVKKILE